LARLGTSIVDGFSAMGTQAWDMVDGAASAVAGMAQIVRMVNPLDPYNVTHPTEYVENLTTVAHGIGHAITHPVDTLKSMVQWDTWKDSPGRAIGSLLPDILLGAATGGAATAATTGRGLLGTASRTLDDVVEAGTRTATRHLDDFPSAPSAPHWTDGTPFGNSSQPGWRDWDFGPRSHTDAPTTSSHVGSGSPTEIGQRLDPQPPIRADRSDPDYDYPEDPLRPGPDDHHADSHNNDRSDTASGADHPAAPDQPTVREPDHMSPEQMADPEFRATDVDHAAYREQYGNQTHDARILEEIRSRNPDAVDIPDEELLAIDRQMGPDSADVNRALWHENAEALTQLDPQLRNLNSAINRLPDFEGTAYRGIEVSADKLPALLERYTPGAEVKELGFTHADKSVPYSGNVQFIMESHTGKDITWMRDPYGGQQEIVFPSHNRSLVTAQYWDPQANAWKIHITDLGR
jgi:hypothetical protein